MNALKTILRKLGFSKMVSEPHPCIADDPRYIYVDYESRYAKIHRISDTRRMDEEYIENHCIYKYGISFEQWIQVIKVMDARGATNMGKTGLKANHG